MKTLDRNMAPKDNSGGRPSIGKKAGTFVGVTLPPDMLRRVDAHARALHGRSKASRTNAIRDLIERGLEAAESEFE
jgi:metal-responsive CopG/Arc/MetJ family transcriptional regulator